MTLFVKVALCVAVNLKKIKKKESEVSMVFKSLTGIDNSTHDVGRITLLIGVIVFCVNSVWSVYFSRAFDAVSFGTGFGLLAAGIGGLLKLKEGTEPPAKVDV